MKAWLIRKLYGLWHDWQHWHSGRPRPLTVRHVPELPETVAAQHLYLAGENGYLWCAALLCPCGCGAILYLNLLPETRPGWRVVAHRDGTATLHPSIQRQVGCRSHFFLRRGRITWA